MSVSTKLQHPMELYLNIFQILILLGTINGFVWALLIWSNKGKGQPSSYLALLVLLMALGSIKIILQEQVPGFNYLLPVPLLYQFALGPLLYLYMKSSLDKATLARKMIWVHFIPCLLFDLLATIVFYRLKWHGHGALVEKMSFMLDILAMAGFALYWVASLRLISRYHAALGRELNPLSINWAWKAIAASALIMLSWLVYIGWVLAFGPRLIFGMQPYYPIYLVFCLCIYVIGISGYYRPELGMLSIPKTARKILMDKVELGLKARQVVTCLKEGSLYLDDKLSLQRLAKKLNLPPGELSYVINVGLEMNFKDLVNDYRVNEVKKRLSDPKNQQFNLLGIAYQAGFNSKASFYRAFKKSTGKTPSEYYPTALKSK